MKKITAALVATALILTGCGTPTESDSASSPVGGAFDSPPSTGVIAGGGVFFIFGYTVI